MLKILIERGGVSTQLYMLEDSMCEDLLSTNSLTNVAGFSAASRENAEQTRSSRWRLHQIQWLSSLLQQMGRQKHSTVTAKFRIRDKLEVPSGGDTETRQAPVVHKTGSE